MKKIVAFIKTNIKNLYTDKSIKVISIIITLLGSAKLISLTLFDNSTTKNDNSTTITNNDNSTNITYQIESHDPKEAIVNPIKNYTEKDVAPPKRQDISSSFTSKETNSAKNRTEVHRNTTTSNKAEKPSLFAKEAFKDPSQKNIAFFIKNNNKIDSEITNRLNREILNYDFNATDIFQSSSLQYFKSFNTASKQFIEASEIQKYTDAYFICDVNIRTEPNPYNKSQFTAVIDINGILIDVRTNTKKPFKYDQIIEPGITQTDANKNVISDMSRKVAQFINEHMK